MRRSLLVLPVLAVAAVAVGGGLWLARPPTPPPNVLVILWDTTRADRLSLYGYPVPTTPRLEAFAKSATVYERASAQGMWTVPTHTSMFTGLAESSHGARSDTLWLDNAETTLAESLGGAGYQTFAFSANLMVSPMTNLTQGFQTVHTSFSRPDARRGRYTRAARRATVAKLLPEDRSTEISPGFAGSKKEKWGKSVFKDAAPVAHQALTEWLDERDGKGRPFFAYLNLMEAHSPRVPSMASRQRVSDQATIDLGLRTDSSLMAANEHIVGKRTFTDAEKHAIAAIYDATLRDLDDATGDLLDDLAARGILDDTVVVVTADHGETLGEHGFYEHRWNVLEPLLHVPLVIRYPKRFTEGARVSERVTTADLYATVLELAGLTPPGKAWSTSLVGRKVFDPFVFAQAVDPVSSQLLSIREAHPDVDVLPLARSWCVAYEDAWKLVWEAGGQGHALYDLATDPGEDANRYATEPERAAALAKALHTFEAGLSPYDPAQRDAQDLERVTREGPGGWLAGEDDDEAAALALLGYTAGEGVDVPKRTFCGPYGDAQQN